MRRSSITRAEVSRLAMLGLALLWAAGCSRPGGPDSFSQSEFPTPPGSGTGTGGTTVLPVVQCMPVHSSDNLPARSTITGGQDAGTAQPTYFTADLFGLFNSVCGGCHVGVSNGGFEVSQGTFATLVDQNVYNILTSDDPTVFMPPQNSGGIPFSQRPPSDAQVELAYLMNLWLMQMSPTSTFDLPVDPNAATSTGYAVSPTMATQLTNIGTCIPPTSMVATGTDTMDQLDTFFEQATSLPATLDQTDLVTLDSAALAKNGVISYAPTYPLWSDNAGKMRYVRVPRGKSITLDKQTQQFDIPPNTRFYKTFLKQVVDASGNPNTYKKIETRLIVSRPDINMPDGTVQQTALYGTYLWNEDESQASLLTDPLRDGKPFADRLFTYITDESKAQAIIDQMPDNLGDALLNAGVARHYAVPSAERCVQCHMGSPSQSFILGFTPLQVSRRANSEGGVYEAAVGDELTQLQRLIDYGVVTGVTSAADILPLEQAEGTRAPRNDHELAAQAYMVGNCAHCHNARGFPSTKEPALKGFLTFLPGAGSGEGIFQMPLDFFSPIRQRGTAQNVPIPYITPSLYDYPTTEATPKFFCADSLDGSCTPSQIPWFVLAPWRSLIYRNTDTPYDYFDDNAPFPHMPLNSPGYDCRVASLMGDWMVSIPAVLKDPTKEEGFLPTSGSVAGTLVYPASADADAQPYRESKPGDPDYAQAVSDASARLASYHTVGYRYGFCPSTYTADIVDPVIAQQVNANQPVTSDTGVIFDQTQANRVAMPVLTPLRPNWVNFDDTDPPGDWFPRRPDWETALFKPDVTAFVSQETTDDNLSADQVEDLTNVLNALETVSPFTSAVQSELTQQVPYGLWDTTVAGCDFSSIPTVASIQGSSNAPEWMAVAPPPDPNAPVYTQSYGSAIFNSVCFNCHGVNADANGLLADEISMLTGGDARVANFRDGLFGPEDNPEANLNRVYGPDAATLGGGLTAKDLAARYMAWMALGGTAKHLPPDVLTEVSDTPVLGQYRQNLAEQGTPDMLRVGLDLCEEIASSDPNATRYLLNELIASGRYSWSQHTGLIDINGDADMWLHLCNLGNRPIVRVPLSPTTWDASTDVGSLQIVASSLYWGQDDKGNDLYGVNPVMDQHGNVANGLTADNLFPLCIAQPTDPTQLQFANNAIAASPVKSTGKVIPYCPKDFLQDSNHLVVPPDGLDYPDGRKWAARGAINAALAVFLYVDGMERDPSTRSVPFNQCNLIGKM